MKRKNTFGLLLVLVSLILNAQDTTLPASPVDIHLRSGKVIKEVRLWKIYFNRTEYMSGGSLHDVANPDIGHFTVGCEKYRLSDTATLCQIKYDKIMLVNGDTLLCKIKLIKTNGLYYVPADERDSLFIENWLIQKYIIQGTGETIVNHTNVIDHTPGVAKYNDRIILFDGDTLYCVMKKIKPDGIAYFPLGNSSYAFIERAFVKKYIIGVGDSSIGSKQADSLTAILETRKAQTVDYYKRGEREGHKEYTGVGSFIGGMVMGFIPVVGWVTLPITLVVPPVKNPHNKKLYAQNIDYHRGYEEGARKKKSSATLFGGFTGAAVLLACIFL